ncbi:diguanylate cyclase with PAS/PAC sensor [Paenibacillus curdlanolyticus YK9]|uniref:Diguanylate cyclase with PAS/PAC sensor n=1 Tax=Paenibacillus curdlanolyticus YK9 TaxID=717606 RepID=E0ICW0_9BACL|nr:sensor domain-containing diguanylate cyclase [Paenibacillus curdlanolyticus]EFM09675.1 diguanylate cyclase with PAS/PAC sensor [Paenibacillus curdlanolyticus YK9]
MNIQLDHAPCGYFSITSTGVIRSVNQTLAGMLGYDRQQLLDQHVETMMSVANKLFFHTYFYPYIQLYGHVKEMYFSLRTMEHQDVPVLLNGVQQERDGEVFIDCVVVEMRKRIEHEKDILHTKTKLEELYRATNEANQKLELLHAEYEAKQQELLRLNHQLEALASTDPLTGLRNRRFFQEQLLANIALFQRMRLPFSLLIVDIDHFKAINDTFGHPVGDAVLTDLGQMLRSMSRESDIVARYGGEEFVIIAPSSTRDNAKLAAERFRAQIEAATLGGCQVTVSIGVATMTSVDTDVTLLQKADQALYASKSNGRNRVTHAADRTEA